MDWRTQVQLQHREYREAAAKKCMIYSPALSVHEKSFIFSNVVLGYLDLFEFFEPLQGIIDRN